MTAMFETLSRALGMPGLRRWTDRGLTFRRRYIQDSPIEDQSTNSHRSWMRTSPPSASQDAFETGCAWTRQTADSKIEYRSRFRMLREGAGYCDLG